MYNERVIKEFRHPKNFGEIKCPDGKGTVGNPQCGDIMELYLKIGKNREGKEVIKDIKIKSFGCVVAIANASVLTQLAKGKTIEEAEKLTKNDLLKELGDVPPIKIHCSLLAVDALKEAIQNYKENQAKRKQS